MIKAVLHAADSFLIPSIAHGHLSIPKSDSSNVEPETICEHQQQQQMQKQKKTKPRNLK